MWWTRIKWYHCHKIVHVGIWKHHPPEQKKNTDIRVAWPSYTVVPGKDFVLLACKCQKHGKETSTGKKMHTIPEQFWT